jgi:hypothetical protein
MTEDQRVTAAREAAERMHARMLAENGGCPCGTCYGARMSTLPWPDRISRLMVVCEHCGNKRCPHATHHDNACTGSNEPGQPGSGYPAFPAKETP